VTVTWEGVAVTVVVVFARWSYTPSSTVSTSARRAGEQLGKVPVIAGVLVSSCIYYVS
jgi:hypothetical protein